MKVGGGGSRQATGYGPCRWEEFSRGSSCYVTKWQLRDVDASAWMLRCVLMSIRGARKAGWDGVFSLVYIKGRVVVFFLLRCLLQ